MQRLARAIRREDGMTIIELMVAMMICVVGLLSTLAVLDQSRQVGDKAEAREAMAHHAERELEQIIGLSWARLGHPTMPAAAGAPPNPQSYVNAGRYSFDRRSGRNEALVVIPAVPGPVGLVPSSSTEWIDNQSRMKGDVYRFVTDAGQYARRVTVVVTVDPPATAPPLYMSTLVTDPRP